MRRLLADVQNLLETAAAAGGASCGLDDLAIVVSGSGALRMLDGAGWSTEALRLATGAETVFRVDRRGDRVRVEGRSAGHACTLETRRQDQAARSLLGPPSGSRLLIQSAQAFGNPLL